ncbi:MAG: TetR/AcrR family transcriptional regulator [Spirochaetales bacterium]|nr:TetR/AcrR family transcriptional regulator [Spirochaetales bacterium]
MKATTPARTRIHTQPGTGAKWAKSSRTRPISPGPTVYNHFHGLDGLITELAGPVLDSSLAAFKVMLEEGGTPHIRDILSVLFSLWTENHDTFFIMCMNDLPLTGSLEDKHREFVSLFITVLHRSKERVRFRIMDEDKVARLIFLTFPHILKAAVGSSDPEGLFISSMTGLLLKES